MRLHSFGDVILPQLNAIHKLPVAYRSSVIELQGGGFDMDGANSYPETKMFTASFWVSSQDVNDIDDFLDDLFAEGAKGRRNLVAKMRDDSLRKIEAKMIQGIASPDTKTYIPDALTGLEGYERCQVSFEVTYPYWKALADDIITLDEGWTLDSGLSLDSGQQETATLSSTSTVTMTVDNTGKVAHEDFVLSFVGNTGVTLTDLTIENTTTGEQIDWSGSLSAGDILTIKTLPQTIDKNGTGEFDNVTLPNTQLGFMSLALGENSIEITPTSLSGGTVSVTLTWQRQYAR